MKLKKMIFQKRDMPILFLVTFLEYYVFFSVKDQNSVAYLVVFCVALSIVAVTKFHVEMISKVSNLLKVLIILLTISTYMIFFIIIVNMLGFSLGVLSYLIALAGGIFLSVIYSIPLIFLEGNTKK